MRYIHVDNWREYTELKLLQDLSVQPKQLYAKGKWELAIFSDCVAVVGSRRLTTYGRQVIERLVPQLVLQGKTIVSGFMYGADQYAHEVCIENGGKTIAVLGWGITFPLEDYQIKLADKIIQSGGILLSEWLDQKPTLWTFPVRNRIVAALSQEVYVIEAAIKSGSLLTAEAARKLGRKVWAVPGPLTSKTSEGTNWLIAEKRANILSLNEKTKNTQSDDPIIKLLLLEPLTVNEIAVKRNKKVSEVGAALSLLTITGQITEREGKYYVN